MAEGLEPKAQSFAHAAVSELHPQPRKNFSDTGLMFQTAFLCRPSQEWRLCFWVLAPEVAPERPQNTVSSLWHCMGVSQGVEGGQRSQAKVREESSQAEAQNDSRKCLDFSTRREGKQAPPQAPPPCKPSGSSEHSATQSVREKTKPEK